MQAEEVRGASGAQHQPGGEEYSRNCVVMVDDNDEDKMLHQHHCCSQGCCPDYPIDIGGPKRQNSPVDVENYTSIRPYKLDLKGSRPNNPIYVRDWERRIPSIGDPVIILSDEEGKDGDEVRHSWRSRSSSNSESVDKRLSKLQPTVSKTLLDENAGSERHQATDDEYPEWLHEVTPQPWTRATLSESSFSIPNLSSSSSSQKTDVDKPHNSNRPSSPLRESKLSSPLSAQKRELEEHSDWTQYLFRLGIDDVGRKPYAKNGDLRARKRLAIYVFMLRPRYRVRLKRMIKKYTRTIPKPRKYGDCWIYTGLVSSKRRISISFAFQHAGNNLRVGFNIGLVARLLKGQLTQEEKEGIIEEQWTGSHICGNWRCVNWRHIIPEPLKVNISRNRCLHGRQKYCDHAPKCLVHLRQDPLAPSSTNISGKVDTGIHASITSLIDDDDDEIADAVGDGFSNC